VLALDDFYRDMPDATRTPSPAAIKESAPTVPAAIKESAPAEDEPPMPRRFGIVDWDDPASWRAGDALATVVRLCTDGAADVPVYDIPTSRRTGTVRFDLGGAPVFVAEGIFAAELVHGAREAGVLADALCLRLHPGVTFGRRLLRDLAESRKPPLTLVRRGMALARAEPALVQRWTALGCRACSIPEAEAELRTLAAGATGRRGTA
jgi:uridine kinase